MPCLNCEERGRLVKEMIVAHGRRDYVEVRRLLREFVGTAKVDLANLTYFTIRTPNGEKRIDLHDPTNG